ncbi:hypothetical protein HK297_08855, partial [Streptococcus agalactiae]|nr:hypothetical protein [Streptococcus agalactiae]
QYCHSKSLAQSFDFQEEQSPLPNDEILEFMSNLTLKDEDSRKELELIRHKWQF